MSRESEHVMDDALSLPVEARVQLVEKLLQSLNLPTQEEVEEAWAKEVDRRIAEDERGEVEMIPGEKVIAELRRKYGR